MIYVRLNIICLVAVLCLAATGQETTRNLGARAYLESLDDVALMLLRPDVPEAREVFRERAANYTHAQRKAVMGAYQKAYGELHSRDGASVETLLDRINTTDDNEHLQSAFLALHKRYSAADESDLAAIREAYLASWRALPVPAPPDSGDLGMDLSRSRSYLNHMRYYFPHEADALPILEERCVESGLHEGMNRMFSALFGGGFELGPLTAARAEAVYKAEFQSGKTSAMGPQSYFVLEATIQSVLGKCGPSGLEALRRLGTLNTPSGIEALRYMNTPEAEESLGEILEDPATHPLTKLDVMRVLDGYQYTNPNSDRIRRFREPLAGILVVPEDGSSYSLNTLEKAVQMAAKTRDSYYREPILKLERSLDPAALEKADRADTEGLDPEQFPKKYNSNSLRAAIKNAEGLLK